MGTFKITEIERIARQVSKKGKFPFRNSAELMDVLGGRSGVIDFGGKQHKGEEIEQIPSEMFPIVSEDDFVVKMATLRGGRGDVAAEMPRGKQLDKRPAEAGQPPKR